MAALSLEQLNSVAGISNFRNVLTEAGKGKWDRDVKPHLDRLVDYDTRYVSSINPSTYNPAVANDLLAFLMTKDASGLNKFAQLTGKISATIFEGDLIAISGLLKKNRPALKDIINKIQATLGNRSQTYKGFRPLNVPAAPAAAASGAAAGAPPDPAGGQGAPAVGAPAAAAAAKPIGSMTPEEIEAELANINSQLPPKGGRRRKNRKTRKTRKSRKTRKHKRHHRTARR